jgi:hypothetical protein
MLPEQSAAVPLVRREAEVYAGTFPKPGHKEKAMHGSADHKMAWKIDGNHVLPVDDLREHSVTLCWCRPLDYDGVVVHNSLDGREHYEHGDRKVS